MIDPIADYEAERALFDALLGDDTSQRILLFRGDAGKGKTRLLLACQETATNRIQTVAIQFREEAVSVAEIFYRVGDILGWNNFPEFLAAVERMQGGTLVRLESNTQKFGINQQIYAAVTIEKSDEAEQRVALTDAWFADLRLLPFPLLFVFDTYEKAATSVQRWLDGPFLARAARVAHLRVLVAGQHVPDANNIEWGGYCIAHELHGVREAGHWLPVVSALNRHIVYPDPLSFLGGICMAHRGQPDMIMAVIRSLPERGVAP